MTVYAHQGRPVYAWRFGVEPLSQIPLALAEQQQEPLHPWTEHLQVSTEGAREYLVPGDGVYWQRGQPFSICRGDQWGHAFLPIETLFEPLHPHIFVSVAVITLTSQTARGRKSYIYDPPGGPKMFLAKYALRTDGAWIRWGEGEPLPDACEIQCYYTECGRPEIVSEVIAKGV